MDFAKGYSTKDVYEAAYLELEGYACVYIDAANPDQCWFHFVQPEEVTAPKSKEYFSNQKLHAYQRVLKGLKQRLYAARDEAKLNDTEKSQLHITPTP